jgi:hypothetical protein
MTLAMMGAMAVVAVVSVAVAALGALYAARTQTQAVATYPPASDRSPESAAAMMADRNGAVLVGCRCSTETSLATRTVEIITASVVDLPVFGEVEVRASGRAEFDPLRWLGR